MERYFFVRVMEFLRNYSHDRYNDCWGRIQDKPYDFLKTELIEYFGLSYVSKTKYIEFINKYEEFSGCSDVEIPDAELENMFGDFKKLFIEEE